MIIQGKVVNVNGAEKDKSGSYSRNSTQQVGYLTLSHLIINNWRIQMKLERLRVVVALLVGLE